MQGVHDAHEDRCVQRQDHRDVIPEQDLEEHEVGLAQLRVGGHVCQRHTQGELQRRLQRAVQRLQREGKGGGWMVNDGLWVRIIMSGA